MKRKTAIAVGLTLGLALTGCAGGDAEPADTPASPATSTTQDQTPATSAPADSSTATLTEANGLLVDTDLEADAIEGAGLAITIDPAAQTANFQLVDPTSGTDFSDYFEFDYTEQVLRHHKAVAAMGMVFDYTVDLTTNELTSILNADGAESIDAVREQGRFDTAQADRVAEREALESYFEARYGKTIEETATA